MEQIVEMRRQLDRAIAQRYALWQAPAVDRSKAIEKVELTIGRLWQELRATRAEALNRPREEIIVAARAEDRLDRGLTRRR